MPEAAPAPGAEAPAAVPPSASTPVPAADPALAPADLADEGIPAGEANSLQPPAGGQMAAQPQQGFNPLVMIGLVALWMFVIWYMGRSKRKRQQQEQERQNSLKKGDRVVTIGLMHGVVVAFTDDTVTLLTDPKNGAVMVFDRKAVYKILPRAGEEKDAEAGAKGER